MEKVRVLLVEESSQWDELCEQHRQPSPPPASSPCKASCHWAEISHNTWRSAFPSKPDTITPSLSQPSHITPCVHLYIAVDRLQLACIAQLCIWLVQFLYIIASYYFYFRSLSAFRFSSDATQRADHCGRSMSGRISDCNAERTAMVPSIIKLQWRFKLTALQGAFTRISSKVRQLRRERERPVSTAVHIAGQTMTETEKSSDLGEISAVAVRLGVG